MKKLNLSKVFRDVGKSMSKHSPEILMGIGISGMLTTTFLAVKATPKALKLIEKKKKEKKVEKLTAIDTVKATWKCYIPAAAMATVSTACLIGSSRVSLRRNAALATAYKIAETTHKEYREQVVKTIGEKKEQLIHDKTMEEKVKNNPPANNTVFITDKGHTLCYDAFSGRYFKGDIDKIRKAENILNLRLRNENYVSLNDFYDEIGLERNRVGDELGWNIDYGYVEIKISPILAPDEEPCAAISFSVAPEHDYSKFN